MKGKLLLLAILFVASQTCNAETPPECWAHAFIFGEGSYGSCFYIGDGLVVTNAHVVGPKDALIMVHFRNGDNVWGKLKASDSNIDLALIKVDPPKGLSAAVLSNVEAKPGDEVYYIGNPYPLEFVRVTGFVVGFFQGQLASTAVSSSGASGSPLYNKQGLVVGVISGRMGNMPISGAVSLSAIRAFLEKEKHGKEAPAEVARLRPDLRWVQHGDVAFERGVP